MMRIARLACCAAVGVLLLASPSRPVHGQDQQPGATFRSTTTLVEVDVIVLDKKGEFVPDLAAADLTLFEDGKQQNIQQFYMVTHDGTTRTAPQEEERAHRVFVIVFDESHLANDSLLRVKKGAEQFINNLAPGDFGGVFVNGSLYRGRLTTSKTELIAGVQSAKPAFENRQGLLAPLREFPRIPAEIDAARISDGAKQLVDSIAADACREEPVLCEQNGGLEQVENILEKKARHYVRQARVLTESTIQNMQYVSSRLSRIPGRKTVVLLSEGFYIEDARPTLRTVAAQFARAGAAIYSIDGRGFMHGPNVSTDALSTSAARSVAFDTGEDGTTILTAGTGGLSVRNIDDITRAFGLIVRDTSTYYVIGYQPDNATLDNKFRKIEVKTRRDGVKVRARKGYVASALPPVEALRGGGLD
jgi:VWFA-related protein